jgi:Polyketide cyclase / dehydrase and lipid transport
MLLSAPHAPALVVAMAIVLAACAPEGPPMPPDLAMSPAPALEEGHHSTHISTRRINVDAAELWGWVDGGAMLAALESRPPVSKPARVEEMSGKWPETGAVRRVQLEDGNYVLERVLEYRPPELMRYQVWAFTTSAAAQVDYAVGEFRVSSAESGGSDFTWTYRMRAKSALARPFIDGFVRDRFAPFMDNGVQRLKAPG